MTKEYLNVFIADHDEEFKAVCRKILKDIKVRTEVQDFPSVETLMQYLSGENKCIPEIVMINHGIHGKSALDVLEELRNRHEFMNTTAVLYGNHMEEYRIDEAFVKGANIFMNAPDNNKVLKKNLTEMITISWQYYSSGLNRDHFIMKI